MAKVAGIPYITLELLYDLWSRITYFFILFTLNEINYLIISLNIHNINLLLFSWINLLDPFIILYPGRNKIITGKRLWSGKDKEVY